MTIVIVTKGIGSKKRLFDDKAFMADLEQAMQQSANDVLRDFQATVRTWNDKPEFQVLMEIGANAEVLVGTDDQIYKYVSGGTRVRYAHMTPGFEAKTTPRFIGSFRGAGGLAFINTRFPLPGIEAREFDQVIEKKNKKRHQRRIEAVMKRNASRSG